MAKSKAGLLDEAALNIEKESKTIQESKQESFNQVKNKTTAKIKQKELIYNGSYADLIKFMEVFPYELKGDDTITTIRISRKLEVQLSFFLKSAKIKKKVFFQYLITSFLEKNEDILTDFFNEIASPDEKK